MDPNSVIDTTRKVVEVLANSSIDEIVAALGATLGLILMGVLTRIEKKRPDWMDFALPGALIVSAVGVAIAAYLGGLKLTLLGYVNAGAAVLGYQKASEIIKAAAGGWKSRASGSTGVDSSGTNITGN